MSTREEARKAAVDIGRALTVWAAGGDVGPDEANHISQRLSTIRAYLEGMGEPVRREVALCEWPRIHPHPNSLYETYVDPTCAACQEAAVLYAGPLLEET